MRAAESAERSFVRRLRADLGSRCRVRSFHPCPYPHVPSAVLIEAELIDACGLGAWCDAQGCS